MWGNKQIQAFGRFFFLSLLLFSGLGTVAQENKDSLHEHRIDEITIIGPLPAPRPRIMQYPGNITFLGQQDIRKSGSFSISDGLAKINGISQLNTGVGISKPVVRGLYGNRVAVVLSGSKFENQQWQDEHGLGLSDISINHVEIIKGPASLLYGAEAMGGAIVVVEEQVQHTDTNAWDANLRFFSNTLGNATDVGYKTNKGKYSYRIRGGMESHADYTDGNGGRVLNSRFGGYTLKAGIGYKGAKWTSQNNLSSSFNRFGFIMQDIANAKDTDCRFCRGMDGPHHAVATNVLTTQNTYYTKKYNLLTVNAGLQSNLRMEDEGGGAISLNMHMLTLNYNILYRIKLGNPSRNYLTLGHMGQVQNNANYGGRVIIPDANLGEAGLTGYFLHTGSRWTWDAGAGAFVRYVKTFATRNLNSGGAEIDPFTRTKPAVTGSVGIAFTPNDHWVIKAHSASGFRSANLAELSSNGLHEGIFRYEIGNPNMRIEKNLNSEILAQYDKKQVFFSAAMFYNRFWDYIYLTPTGKDRFGFPVFIYTQNNAALFGSEATVIINPAFAKKLNWKNTFSTVTGRLDDGNYLPYIPANRISSTLRYILPLKTGRLAFVDANISAVYTMAQNHPSIYETTTGDYTLLNAGFSTQIKAAGRNYDISLACNNLLNTYYYDHLSRFKPYGIHNVGRNIVLNIHIPLTSQRKQ